MIVNRNVNILYVLTFLNNSFFWYGIWIFYYLLFTDYAGIGLIESVMIFSAILFEIPSGAIADLIGRKKTLFVSFLFLAIGNIIMAMAFDYSHLLLSVFLLSVAGSFYSGTVEALAYDSLKEKNQEKYYSRVVSNFTTIQMIAIALASIFGGFLFTKFAALPFYVTGLFAFFGLIFVLILKEPFYEKQDSFWKSFIVQNKYGLRELTKTSQIKYQTIFLLSIAFFSVVCLELLNDVLAVEFGFTASQLGIFMGVLSLIVAITSQFTTFLSNKFNLHNLFFVFGIVIAITLIISPFVGLILGGVTIIIRFMSQTLFDNFTSILINENTISKYRATTISTFNFIKNLPYVIVAYYIGYLMDVFSAKVFALGIGVLLFVLLLIQYLFYYYRK